jgi:choline dehydrogenase-like flavoprotein
MPPSADIINTWESLRNLGWTLDILKPYYTKIHAEPSLTAQEEKLMGITWGEGKTGMIQTSYPDPLTDPIPAAWEETFRGLGHLMTADPFGGAPSGAFMPLASVDPTTAYWEPAQNRSNLHLLTGNTVQKILFDSVAGSSSPINLTATGIEYSNATSGILTALATKEVILAAGAFNSPKLLELRVLATNRSSNSLDIPVTVENANVGENLMDHLFSELAGKQPLVSPQRTPSSKERLHHSQQLSSNMQQTIPAHSLWSALTDTGICLLLTGFFLLALLSLTRC